MRMDSFAPPVHPVVRDRGGELDGRGVIGARERRADRRPVRVLGQIPDERGPVLYDAGRTGIDEGRDQSRAANRIILRPRSDADLQPAIRRSS